MARSRTWALVTNGVRARILRGLDDGEAEDPIELVSKSDSPHLRDILTDRPGRSFASDASGRRSAMEPGSDPILHDMETFARETCDVLEDHLRAGDMTRLAVFAAPRMLGVLRHQMPDTLKGAVFLERDLNLVNLSEADLRETVNTAIREEPSS